MSVLLADGRLPGVIEVEAEFLVPGAFGTCGPNTLAMAETYGAQSYVSTPTLYNRMRAANRCDPSGVTQGWKIRDQARADGFRVAEFVSGGIIAFTKDRLAEGATVAVEPSRGQALVDLISGRGMNATNLQYHFNLASGYFAGGYNAHAGKNLPEGFWFCDGDNGATSGPWAAPSTIVNGRPRMTNGRTLQYYALDNLIAAAPVWACAIYPKVGIGMSTAPAGLGAGFAALYVRLGMSAGVTVAETYYNEHESVAVFADGTVFHYDNRTNQSIADTSRSANNPSIITGLVAALQAAKAAPAPAPAVLTAQQQADIMLGQAFRAAVKAA